MWRKMKLGGDGVQSTYDGSTDEMSHGRPLDSGGKVRFFAELSLTNEKRVHLG
jgi:hypothetical protein